MSGRATQHQGTDHLTVNNTLVRRTLTRIALKTTARLFYHWQGPCVPISSDLIVKSGRSVHLTEAATINFIAANTSIPVPRIYCAFVHNNECHIVMQRIKGVPIAHVLATTTEQERRRLLRQLKCMMQELRALSPPSSSGTRVESCVGGSLRDSRIPRSNPRFGPFETIQAFHYWLRDSLRLEDVANHPDSEEVQDVRNMINRQDGPWPRTIFTHGDLNPFNIIVRENNIVGIIDWEFAGWYPNYWEYTSAWCGNVVRPTWQDMLPLFLDAFPEELKMEITRQKSWGDLF